MFTRLNARRHAFADLLGKRGQMLVMFGFIFSLYAIRNVIDPATDDGRFFSYAQIDPRLRVLMWAVPVIVAILAAVKAIKIDTIGFIALMIPSSIVMVSYFFSFLGYLAGLTTTSSGLVQAGTWGIITFLIYHIAGWPEPQRLPSATPPAEVREQTVVILDDHPRTNTARGGAD